LSDDCDVLGSVEPVGLGAVETVEVGGGMLELELEVNWIPRTPSNGWTGEVLSSEFRYTLSPSICVVLSSFHPVEVIKG